ncbi:RimJ/RimL family protein N-acetyltransferase [Stackebrandtia albiflava]|uniref:RimJ/RimL family protein N-acetyltransferase n=1 Tax=Stackebrandtia albiflava TaxID=406432 RepID=A0A562V4N7_9ACTN|nr:GNAT family N-acetyltransferase [Stackebrandtia albiflava]TWJ12843.1 RimJ/RimL family protein N-acetyltransferase [Stackebrandtia albiflava]
MNARRFPATPWRTERLLLRPLTPEDADDVAATCADPSVGEFIYSIPRPYRRSDAEEFISGATARWQEGTAQWAIADPATGRYLGGIGVPRLEWAFETAEIGYLVAPWARGEGYAAEAAAGVADFLFRHGVRRAELHISPANIASRRTASRAGFRQDGRLRAAITDRSGARVDRVVYSRVPEDPPGPVHRTLPDFPDGGLSDGVVTLRPLRPDDVEPMFRMYSDPDVWGRCVPPRPPERTEVEEACRFGAAERWLEDRSAQVAVVAADDGRYLGEVDLHMFMGPPGEGMLSYQLTSEARGHGHITRAARLLADWAFDAAGVVRLVAGTAVDNTASQAVLTRLGFTREGVERSRLPGADGSRVDNVSWSLLSGERTWT